MGPSRRADPQWPALASLLVAAFLAVSAGRPALACSCSQVTPEDLVKRTPVVLSGRVVDAQRSRPPGIGYDLVTATVEVSERWKGEVPERVAVHGHGASSMCGWSHFPAGEPLTILARSQATSGDWPGGLWTDYCSMSAYYWQRAAVDGLLSRRRAERERLDAAVAASPGAPLPLLERARFFEEWQDLAAAEAYAEAARIAPGLAPAHLGHGRVLFSLRRFGEARSPLARAVDLAPSDAEAARLLGQARLHTGDLAVLDELRDFQGLEAKSLDLSGRDLRRADFSGARLEAARLDGADLRDGRFRRARIGGSMARSDLRGADLDGFSASGVDLAGARLDGARMAGAYFPGANLEGASLRGATGPDALFANAATAGATFRGASLPGASFWSGRLAGTDFADARLVGAKFDKADLSGADLSRADLRGATFEGARFDCRTRLPRGFVPDRLGMVPAEQVKGCQ